MVYKTLCPYCGVGCGLEASPPAVPGKATNRDKDGNPIWKVMGDKSHPSSLGKVCVKGATISESLDKNRLKTPMMRESLDEPFRKVTWDEALQRIVGKIKTTRLVQGPHAICMYGSGQFQTEDYYIAQKLLKGCLKTNNFDANSRLCMSSAVSGYIQSLGSDGPPCCYDDLELTDCAFLIGTNTAECHPIIFNRLRVYHKKNKEVKLIVVDPRKTQTAEAADLHLAIKPGTDIDLMNGIAHLLQKWGLIDSLFIDEQTTGFVDYAQVIESYPPELVAQNCEISVEDLEQAARWWGESKRVLSLWSMGLNQSSEGTAKNRTLINLHLMTGNMGKPGAGPFSLTGQPNAMGGREAGGLAHILPGYRLVKNEQHRREVEQLWGLTPGSIHPQPGLSAWEMIQGLEQDRVGVLWIAATNPAVSMPDLERTKAALLRSPFTIYQDAYYPTETAQYAHVLLPAAQWSEKTGTMTNSERRVTLCPAFRPAPGYARPDWEIFAEVGRRLGFEQQFDFADSEAVRNEFIQLTANRPCEQRGITYERLRNEGPLQWPCTEGGEPQARMYTDLRFNTPDGRARFAAFHSRGLAEPPDGEYPFVLTVGRLYGHWHTLTRTGRIDKIQKMHPEAEIEVHPYDAEQLGITEGMMVDVRSRRGWCRFPAKLTKNITKGTVFAPMHWGAMWGDRTEANMLTHPEACPSSGQPELKACAVQLIPVSPEALSANSEDSTLDMSQLNAPIVTS
ncbi:molybdopterin oxidoreductase family protein [Roseofilum capinflatum]|uniref:Nitrate reductase n=1 Tax=Roseofilum capinflatum BLCC-M114 TaxID=3022440 RepID=A0ABT7B5G2_9CYAN|nr:nitrate reductase [Roseofilum capinflatum]MDJ1174399.1 nitrate reductase [Roseofilum capinflatum BLCC-M114]